ncbi:MAG: hypothetical protein LBN95_14280 [Prevotellaceae bacterium]|nr:hypothetical protein [Prevotellaceae bacterium]
MAIQTFEKRRTQICGELVEAMHTQDRLISEGKISRPKIKDDIFTPSDEYAFRTGKTFDEILTQRTFIL